LVYKNIDEVYQAFNTLLAHSEVKSVFVKDNFQRKTGYRDINLVVKVSTGKVFELQINTEKLLQSKEH
jgi:ppGpp synthetase/RelA/SpoT-type nucleotidyltranferase